MLKIKGGRCLISPSIMTNSETALFAYAPRTKVSVYFRVGNEGAGRAGRRGGGVIPGVSDMPYLLSARRALLARCWRAAVSGVRPSVCINFLASFLV